MYQNRTEAGVRLAQELQGMALENPVVLALPRGGVPVALPIARALEALRDLVDAVVCPHVPRYFQAVGLHYRQFDQVPDDAVTRMMAEAPRDAGESERKQPCR